jgi:hypothetical protein
LPEAQEAGINSDLNMDSQLQIGNSAGGDCLPGVPFPDVPLPDVPLPHVPLPVLPLPTLPLPDAPLPEACPDGSVGEELTCPHVAEQAMAVAFVLESGSCLLCFLCWNIFISGIDYYTCCEVFGSLRVYYILGFVLVLFYWFYFIHSIMGHHTCSVFATPGV